MRFLVAVLVLAGSAYANTDSLHFCQIVDLEQWEKDHPQPAGKRLGDWNIGIPRTVQMIYFLPNDLPYRQEVVDSMKVRIRQAQTFFADQMEAHGYGRKTFRIETDEQGEPVVHLYHGTKSDSVYWHGKSEWAIPALAEVKNAIDADATVYLIARDTQYATLAGGRGGIAFGGRYGGMALVGPELRLGVVAHELGHTFGLFHDFRKPGLMMGYGIQTHMSECTAEWLAVHPFLDSSIPEESTGEPSIEVLSPAIYPVGARQIPLRFEVQDDDGLQQIRVQAAASLKFCKGLNGEKQATVEFEYDGNSSTAGDPLNVGMTLSSPAVHRLWVWAIDRYGEGIGAWKHFKVYEDTLGLLPPAPPFVELYKVSGDWQEARAGDTLPEPLTVQARDQYGTLLVGITVTFEVIEGGGSLSVYEAVTDAEGKAYTVLTLGQEPATNIVQVTAEGLEQVTFTAISEAQIARIRGTGRPAALEFPVRSTVGSFGVWVRDQYGNPLLGITVTFEVIEGDGTLSVYEAVTDEWGEASTVLTLGSQTGKITLQATVEGQEPVTFTVVGTEVRLHKVSGDGQEGETRTNLPQPLIVEVKSLPNGKAIAGIRVRFKVTAGWGRVSASRSTTDSQGRVSTTWTLGREPGINSVEVTAEGVEPVTFTAVAVPAELRATSLLVLYGPNQQGLVRSALAKPFTVLVRDQFGDSLSGVTVTFGVIEGDGTFSVSEAVTNDEGRAETTVTLGNQPGKNTFQATVEGLEPVTFTAVAKASPDFDGNGRVDLADFFLLSEAFGSSSPRFDLDESGSVDIEDFLLWLIRVESGDPQDVVVS